MFECPVLQIERFSPFGDVRDLEDKFFAGFQSEVEVLIPFAWERTHFAVNVIQPAGKLRGILEGQIWQLKLDGEHRSDEYTRLTVTTRIAKSRARPL